ncbi:MAG TPA: ACP S-malonyltransferase [Arenimonas sp.]|nr:ACP S-malonyltransferase [Arenimonas sp.]HPW32220.1 ACP S-malonyltransferase [Arenimonas sp.]
MKPNLAFVFPGQGSQSVGMLAELAASHADVQKAFAEASEGAGLDLWDLSQNGPEEKLNQTEITQPALLAASIAVWRVWQTNKGVQPAQMSGHSLGEYAALVASGALSLHDGAKLVRERGRLMQAAVPAGIGAMAAVLGAEDALVEEVCREVSTSDSCIVPCNYNSPGQIVIGGHATALERATAVLNERGVRKVIRVAMSVPSHTPLMRDAAAQLGEFMKTMAWTMPDRPVIQNADVIAHSSIEAIQDALVRQLYSPVRWTECVQKLAANGAVHIAECGPGKVLTGLIKRIDKTIDARAIGTSTDLSLALSELA